MIIRAILIITLATASPTFSQTYAELGMMSGSGLVLSPTNIVSPPAQFRMQFGRIGLSKRGGEGLNLLLLGVGLSPIMDAYMRYTSEQFGEVQSLGALAVGGKIMMPFPVPLVRVLSLWMESSTTEMVSEGALNPPRSTRGAILMTPFWNALLRPTFLLGLEKRTGEKTGVMAGANLVIAASQSAQIGLEYLHGYTAPGSDHCSVSGIFRIFPYIGLQVSPGYVATPSVSSWMWIVGISLNSADLNLALAREEKPKDEFRLPTIEELEQQGGQDQKKSGGEEKKSNQESQ